MFKFIFFYTFLFFFFATIPSLRPFLFYNFAVQIILFVFLASIPAYLTKRMSYVDLAWPFGLVAIGVLSLFFAAGEFWNLKIVGFIYLAMGLRMGLGASTMFFLGHFKKEFPRYLYHRMMWKKENKKNESLLMQKEIFLQALANMLILPLPAWIIFHSQSKRPSLFSIMGFGLWILSFSFESLADYQKQKWIKNKAGQKKSFCDVGLWKYCRHPNYFGEWMCWNSLIVISLPWALNLFSKTNILLPFLLTIGLLLISKIMYECLVNYTGARPAEYFSLQKRPGYQAYIDSTNQFFPWAPRRVVTV